MSLPHELQEENWFLTGWFQKCKDSEVNQTKLRDGQERPTYAKGTYTHIYI